MRSGASNPRVLIIGAGYCGLAAAMEFTRRGVPFVLVEREVAVGGLSRTLDVGGVSFELGPHIYFDKDDEVTAFWRSLVGDRLRLHQRSTRIFYRGKYIKSPLSLPDTFAKLGLVTTLKILLSYAAAKLRPRKIESAEDWVIANFGQELFDRFFDVYNTKIWGVPSAQLAGDWAGQRIRSSLITMVAKSVLRDPDFIVRSFNFPEGGSRVLYDAQESAIRCSPNAELRLNCTISQLSYDGREFSVSFKDVEKRESFTDVISTIHLSDLNDVFEYRGKRADHLAGWLEQLRYRNLILVNLVLPAKGVKTMKEHWIDIHDPSITALRITNFSNYLSDPDDERVAIQAEYNCFAEDCLWTAEDGRLIEIARNDLSRMRICRDKPLASSVVRISNAYPMYFKGYKEITSKISEELSKVDRLILAGRNGMYKWNNMHHSVKTGILAARNALGGSYDLNAVRGNVTIGKDSD